MAELSTPWLTALFLIAGVVIALAGTRLAGIADRLADRTGLGEALTGALLLGAATSLPGLVTTLTAAAEGRASFAIGNAVGGIAGQTVFLAIADMFNRRANLEHQAASLPNILSCAVLILLLGLLLAIPGAPAYTIFGVHPATPILFGLYLFGMRLARTAARDPQWKPLHTALTRTDEPDEHDAQHANLTHLILWFVGLAAVTGIAGWVVAQSGLRLAERTGLSDTLVGGFFTALTTSLPELVTAIAAVRRGALTLAVANIVGGNAFDVMFAVGADVVYQEGSIYHALDDQARFMTSVGIVMTAILLAGLVSRERQGIANIGFESFALLVVYLGAFAVMAFA